MTRLLALPMLAAMAFVERHAWKVFALLSAILVLFGLGDVISGGDTFRSGEEVLFRSLTDTTWDELRAADPGAARLIDHQVRSTGSVLLVTGLLSLAVSLTGFRRGEPWAWYAMWVWPLWFVLAYMVAWISAPDLGSGIPVPLISGTVFLVLSVATLLLSYRRYRGRPQAT